MIENVRFGEDGLIPAVAQDAVTGDVLMLAFMNDEALRRTRETGRAHYWSRSRGALWKKGEISGHEQIVQEIRVNCEENSLLLLVRQRGAVCHTGYPTCFYRRLETDDGLSIVRDRAFDPASVYAAEAHGETASVQDTSPLAEATRLQFAAYAYLRDNDLIASSGTSARLRSPDEPIVHRVADELRELAGVLTGQHRHADRSSDLRLEASQVVYWVLLAVLRDGATWTQFRPDLALTTFDEAVSAETLARLLHGDADRWDTMNESERELPARGHSTLALVGQACHVGGIDPLIVIAADLADLRSRPYLEPFFTVGAHHQP